MFFQQVSDAKRVSLEAVARFLPVAGRVDVGAVGEMGAAEFQKTILLDHESRRLAEEVDGVLVDDLFDGRRVMTAGLHAQGAFWHGEWIRDAPIAGGVHPKALRSMHFENVDGAIAKLGLHAGRVPKGTALAK